MTNVKKASLAVIVSLVLIIGICIASFATNTGTILKEAKLRKQASNDSIVLEIIPKKEEVEVLAKVGDWYQVRYNKIKGYVAKDFIEVEEDNNIKEQDNNTQTQKQPKEIRKGENFKIENETKIYVRPLINSKVIANLEKDKTVNVIEIRNNWAYVNIDNISGWVSLTSIGAVLPNTGDNNQTEGNNETQQEPNNNQNENNNNNEQENNSNNNNENNNESSKEELNKTAYIVTSGINFREEPNTDSEVLKVFIQNAKITILAEEGDWYKIKHNDQIGYVIKTYVSDKKTDTTSRSSVGRTESTKKETENTTVTEETKASTANKGQEVANYVKQFVGCRYVYGGSTPKGGFDCSGLTMYVYKQFGISLSHSATAQSKVGTKVSKSNLQPGDLVFFSNYKTGKGIGHVGIYIGDNKFVHASTEKTGVITSSITGSYNTRYVTATRMF